MFADLQTRSVGIHKVENAEIVNAASELVVLSTAKNMTDRVPFHHHHDCHYHHPVLKSSSVPPNASSRWWETMIQDTKSGTSFFSQEGLPSSLFAHASTALPSIKILVRPVPKSAPAYSSSFPRPEAISDKTKACTPQKVTSFCPHAFDLPSLQILVPHPTPRCCSFPDAASIVPAAEETTNACSSPQKIRSTAPTAPSECEHEKNKKLRLQHYDTWYIFLEQLVQYKDRHGHCHFPENYHDINPELSTWVIVQRQAALKGMLSDTRRRQLSEIGFEWGTTSAATAGAHTRTRRVRSECQHDHAWSSACDVQEQEEPRDCRVPQEHNSDTDPPPPPLAHHCVQRKRGHAKKKGDKLLSDHVVPQLQNKIQWEVMLGNLVTYKGMHGDCNVPKTYTVHDNKLGKWVERQRQTMKEGKICAVRAHRLNEMGFVWDGETIKLVRWSTMFDRLVKYKKVWGDCKVPSIFEEDPKLANWVQYQRIAKKDGTLSSLLQKQLNDIGFAWSAQVAERESWDIMFERLNHYKKSVGNCKVPKTYLVDQKLGHWVQRQRKAKRMGKMNPLRERCLSDIGFVWDGKKDG